jgi:DNA-binding YbaB/EbfC family protein
MFDNLKNMYALQKQAKQIKKELHNTHIEAEEGSVVVVINGEQEVISIAIKPEFLSDPKKIEKDLVIALNKGIKKSQQIAAEKMKGIMGEMGMPGLPQA